MVDRSTAPAKQLSRPWAAQRGEASVGASGKRPPVDDETRMERVVERPTLFAAFARVKTNGGSPGIDGMTVADCPGDLQHHWPALRTSLLAGTYHPSPVRRVDSPTPGGGVGTLGLPTGLDRLLQPALLPVLHPAGNPTCADHRDGVRPGRLAHQATARAQPYLAAGDPWVVDLAREKLFARVKQDQLLHLVKGRGADRRVVQRIDRSLKAGALTGDGVEMTTEGTPHGGPVSPLRATLLLDQFDKERERRGHRFVRDADDRNSSVQSARAGQRVLTSVTRFLARRLTLTVTAAQSAVDRPWRRLCWGVTLTTRRPYRRRVSDKALKALKEERRPRTCRTRGAALPRVVQDRQRSLNGWYASFRVAEAQSSFQELDSWGRRRLRCYVWKQWGRHRYRELRKRGGSQDLAWTTCTSAHGPWRLNRSPALASALPGGYFDKRGLPRLYRPSRR
jgi:group II intron reverse transcriptase/maturase